MHGIFRSEPRVGPPVIGHMPQVQGEQEFLERPVGRHERDGKRQGVSLVKKPNSPSGVEHREPERQRREHVNRPAEILSEIEPFFSVESRAYFPLRVPFVFCNLCIGLELKARPTAA